MITIVIHGQASFTTLLRMLRDWFKFMFSIPRHEPMSKTEKFVQWSSLLVYCLGGLTFLAVPKLYGIILNVEYTGRSEGYVRLVGLGVVEIGFLFIILARSTVRIHRYGTILASVVSRLVWVPATGLMFILRNMVPFTFALVFMGLDVLLSLSTLFIWCRERDGSSLGDFLKELLAPFRECHGMKVGGTITAVFFVGLIQTIFWYVLAVRPDFAHKMFVLDNLDGLADGYLAAFLYLISIHGLYHVLCANNLNHPFALASVSYRVLLDTPVSLVLLLVDQIERNLFLTIMSFNMFISTIFLAFLSRERLTITNTREDPPDVQAPTVTEDN